MDSMTEATLDAMKGADGPTVPVVKQPVTDEPQQQPMTTSVQPEGSRTWDDATPQVSSYAERSTQAMARALNAKAAIEREASEQLARLRDEGPKTRTHTSDEAQKGDAFRRSLNCYLGTIREAEIRRGVPENQATKLIAEPVPQPDEPFLDNHDGSGPVIQILPNQEAMTRLFTIGTFADGTRVIGGPKGVSLA